MQRTLADLLNAQQNQLSASESALMQYFSDFKRELLPASIAPLYQRKGGSHHSYRYQMHHGGIVGSGGTVIPGSPKAPGTAPPMPRVKGSALGDIQPINRPSTSFGLTTTPDLPIVTPGFGRHQSQKLSGHHPPPLQATSGMMKQGSAGIGGSAWETISAPTISIGGGGANSFTNGSKCPSPLLPNLRNAPQQQPFAGMDWVDSSTTGSPSLGPKTFAPLPDYETVAAMARSIGYGLYPLNEKEPHTSHKKPTAASPSSALEAPAGSASGLSVPTTGSMSQGPTPRTGRTIAGAPAENFTLAGVMQQWRKIPPGDVKEGILLLLGTMVVSMEVIDDHDALVSRIAKQACLAVQGDNCSVLTLEDGLLRDELTGIQEPFGGITKQVIQSGQSCNLTSAESSPYFDPHCDPQGGLAFVAVPIIEIGTKKNVLGVLRVVRFKSLVAFTPAHQHYLEVFATITGVLLRYAQLLRASRTDLERTSLLLDVARSVSSKVMDNDMLVAAILENARQLTKADKCSLFVVHSNTEELELIGGEHARMPITTGIPGLVATGGQTINIVDAHKDPRFNRTVDLKTGYRTRSILCMPVTHGDQIVAVAQLINKEGGQAFTRDDENTFNSFASFAGISLRTAELFRMATFEQQKSQAMLSLAATLSSASLDQEEKLVNTVINSAKELIGSDRCSLFLVDEKRTTLEAYFGGTEHVRIPITTGIAGHVASTGETVNIADAYSDARFNKSVDIKTGYRTQSILCMPLKYEGTVVAVAQLVNKLDKNGEVTSFTNEDEQLFVNFSTYAGVSLRNSRLFALATFLNQKATVMLELAATLSSATLDGDKLPTFVVDMARKLINSDRCALFLVDNEKHELEAYLGDTIVRMPINAGIAGHVATTGQTVNIVDAYSDSRFNKAVDLKTGYVTKSILCMPVKYEGTTVAVAQLVNKLDRQSKVTTFSKEDEDLFVTFSTYAGVALRNCAQHLELVKAHRRNHVMMSCLEQLGTADVRQGDALITTIASASKSILHADRCTVFLVDKEHHELYSKVQLETGGKVSDQVYRIRMDQGIAGEVATTGKGLNISNPYEDSRFNPEIDKQLGYVTQCILTMPVIHRDEVVAVIQAVNKTDGMKCYSKEDQQLLADFCMFAAISLANAKIYQFVLQSNNDAMQLLQAGSGGGVSPRNRSQAPAISKIGIVDPSAVNELRRVPLTPEEKQKVLTIEFNIFEYKDDTEKQIRVIPLIVELFRDVGALKNFDVDEETLYRFLISVQRLYRSVPYHNFFHAVDATQTVYLLIKFMEPIGVLEPLDKFVLLTTAMVHDVDHMGLNNSFHLRADTPMGILSSASGTQSVLEVHHSKLAVELLTMPHCNIFLKLSKEHNQRAFKSMIDCILATDMAKHNDLLAQFTEAVKDPSPSSYKDLLMKMIIHTADLSNIAKPFPLARRWGQAVTEEFHKQGDLEAQQGLKVAAMFDRTKAHLARDQMGFIDFVGMQHYTLLAKWNPALQTLLDNVKANREQWAQIKELEDSQMSARSGTGIPANAAAAAAAK